ncbi:hypothetical protein B4916_15935 [Yersinia intermedia]|nr:hypothetical protein B4916_15935 [Yersinia intermedia]
MGGEAGEKLIKQAERKLALSKLEGQEKAKQQALYDAEDAKVTDPLAIKQLQDAYAQTEANSEAKKTLAKETASATKEENKAAAENARRVKQLQELQSGTEALILTEQRRYREAAQADAVSKLGKDATAAQIKEAQDLAGQEFDIKQRINDRKAASDINYYAAADLKRKDDLDQTDRMLKAELITFEQAQARKAQIAVDYQKRLQRRRQPKQ